ncbi:MAG: DUF2069 domain-containing protein [Candidatus Protistobacter heckmanni]|nr:DUF2069 domain-containing protein [Candidatus Protistobacter heckmanni]
MAALVVLCIAWEFWLAPLRPGGSWLALKVLPLLPALRGVWRKRLYTMQWASMLLLVYEAEGLVRGSSDAGLSAMLGWIEAGLSFVAYLVLVSYVRPYKNLHKQLNIYPAFKQ